MSTITQPISQLIHRLIRRPTHLGRHIDRHSKDMSTNISVDTRAICRPIHRLSVSRYIDRDVDQYIGRGVHKIHMIPFFYGNSYKPYIFYFQKLVNFNKQAWTAMYKLLTKLTCYSSSGEHWPSVIFGWTYNSCTWFVLSQLQASIPQLTTLELG